MNVLKRFAAPTRAATIAPRADLCQFGLHKSRGGGAALISAAFAGWLGIAVLAAQPDKRQVEAIQLARSTLAERLSLLAEQITTVTVAPAQWRDSALGCPERGVVSRPVVTSGFKVTLRAAEREYTVHVAGGRAAFCGSQADTRLSSATLLEASLKAAGAVRAAVAAHLDIDPAGVSIATTRPARSGASDCPEAPDKPSGAAFLVEGEARGTPFRYYTDDRVTVSCDPPQAGRPR